MGENVQYSSIPRGDLSGKGGGGEALLPALQQVNYRYAFRIHKAPSITSIMARERRLLTGCCTQTVLF
jgi:hypothetical protein